MSKSTVKEDILARAKADYNPSLVAITIPDDVLSIKKKMGLTQRAYHRGYTYPETLGGLYESAKAYILFAALSYQFRFDDPFGGVSKVHYKEMTGGSALSSVIYDTRPFSSKEGKAAFLAVMNTYPHHESRVSISEAIFFDQGDGGENKLGKFIESFGESVMTEKYVGCEEAQKLADLFPEAFSDPYLKKAQFAVSLLGNLYRGDGYNFETDLLCFPDYELPRILNLMGMLSFSQEFKQRISNGPLENSDEYMRAVRSATVLAVQKISEATGISPDILDNIIWEKQAEYPETVPHLANTTYY